MRCVDDHVDDESDDVSSSGYDGGGHVADAWGEER